MRLVKFSLLKRRRDLDREAFGRHWGGRHVEVLLAAGHRAYNLDYVQNRVIALPEYGLADERFDGAAQLVQRSPAAGATGFQDDPRSLRDVRPDECDFLDVESACALFTRAVPRQVAARPGPVKLLTFFRWRPGVARGDRDVEAPWRLMQPVTALVSSAADYFTVEGGSRPFTEGHDAGPPVLFDGVREVTFADLAALKRAIERSDGGLLTSDPAWAEDGLCRFAAHATVVYDDAPRH